MDLIGTWRLLAEVATDAAASPALLTTPQVRHVRFSDANRIVLSPPIGFMGQADVRREYTWERIG
jgi:hypothetical protein